MLVPSARWSQRMAPNAKGSLSFQSLDFAGRPQQLGIIAWPAPQRRRNEWCSFSTSAHLGKKMPRFFPHLMSCTHAMSKTSVVHVPRCKEGNLHMPVPAEGPRGLFYFRARIAGYRLLTSQVQPPETSKTALTRSASDSTSYAIA